ncbi:MAG: hypothetical protein Q9170_005261 [Blastenia crenularia]
MYSIASVGAIASGTALPLMTVVFGSFTTKFSDFSIDAMSSTAFKHEVNTFVLYYIYIFVARFVLTYISTVLVKIASIRTTKALRRAFLASTLGKEIEYFDIQNGGSVATQVTTNGNMITQGTSDKLLLAFQAVATLVSAFVVALALSWKLALITLSCVPLIFIVTAVVMGLDTKIESKIGQMLSTGAVIAQESISSLSTIQAFWAHDRMMNRYEKWLDSAHKQGNRKSPVWGSLPAT